MNRNPKKTPLTFIYQVLAFSLTVLLVTVITMTPSGLSQSSLTDLFVGPAPEAAVVNDSEVSTAQVTLDGRVVFYAAAASIAEEGTASSTPAILRAQVIQERLSSSEVARISPDDLMVEFKTDETSRLPIIYVNDLYLMTVTTLDARIRGVNVEIRAQELVTAIQDALVLSYEQRRPEYLINQGIKGAIILAVVGIISFLVHRHQDRLAEKIEALIEDPEKQQQPIETIEVAGKDLLDEEGDVKRKLPRLRPIYWNKRAIYRIQLRTLEIFQVGLWLISSLIILGLFPQTRPIQLWLIRGIEGPILKILITIGIVYFLIQASHIFIQNLLSSLRRGGFLTDSISDRRNQRLITFANVLKGSFTFAILIIGILAVLAFLGIDTAPILAGAGILGLGISFGAQSLVKDIINGVFILLEDQFGVGDVIDAGGFSGKVEQLNLRTTQIRNADGELITIPNSFITVIKNKSSNWSRVNLGIDVAYGTDIDQAIAIIAEVANQMSLELPWKILILEPPTVLGVDNFGADGITIRVWIKTKPLEQWSVGREYRRRLKIRLDEEGISIPFPQRSIWLENYSSLTETVTSQESSATDN